MNFGEESKYYTGESYRSVWETLPTLSSPPQPEAPTEINKAFNTKLMINGKSYSAPGIVNFLLLFREPDYSYLVYKHTAWGK